MRFPLDPRVIVDDKDAGLVTLQKVASTAGTHSRERRMRD